MIPPPLSACDVFAGPPEAVIAEDRAHPVLGISYVTRRQVEAVSHKATCTKREARYVASHAYQSSQVYESITWPIPAIAIAYILGQAAVDTWGE